MNLQMIYALLAVPLIFAGLLFFLKSNRSIAAVARIGAAGVILCSAAFCIINFKHILIIDLSEYKFIPCIILGLSLLMALYLIYTAVKMRSALLFLFSAAGCALNFYSEMAKEETETAKTIYVDRLSLLMILIIGIIGGIICIYTAEYLKDYHHHHTEIPDRRGLFFAIMFVFLSSMFGLVMFNDMSMMLFCWEITTLCSFLLIRYIKTEEAVKNARRAIEINVFGGLCFSAGIMILSYYGVYEFTALLAHPESRLVEPAIFLIAVAGLIKAAQFPFSGWLLGAMVAPSPSSALLHSSTMVKAGVYLLLRLSPMLGGNLTGRAVTMVGGVTFLTAAAMAVSQIDSKRLLAYSTLSNLGLIVACAGINTAESLWAAIMLIVFHAIAKSLLFLSVGSTEHQLSSREVENMDGLIGISRQLTIFLIVGIAGMFVAPFGMLVSKWAAMKAFLDSGNRLIVLLVAFGSTVTLFFWTKWMGKLIANAHRTSPTSYKMGLDEKISLYSLAAMVIAVCLAHPVISTYFVIPYINSNDYVDFSSPINPMASTIIIFMLCLVFVLPVILMPIYRKHAVKRTSLYLSGANAGDDESFVIGENKTQRFELRNYYLDDLFSEKIWFKISFYLCLAILIMYFMAAIGHILGFNAILK